jgi:hypothetical protein
MERLGNLGVQLFAVGSQKLKNGRFHPVIPAGLLSVTAHSALRTLPGQVTCCSVWLGEQDFSQEFS